jgi:hypothetical protein
MASTHLLREQRLTILGFLQAFTIPIVAEKREDANVIGAGALFDFGDYGHKDLGVPDAPTGPGMHTLGSFNIRQGRTWDIAILQLTGAETVAHLRAGWTVLSGVNIRRPGGSGTALFSNSP